MIQLYYISGDILVFNVDTWVELRKTHRIMGDIVGNANHIPALPLRLMPEEALLLINRNVAVLKEVITCNSDEKEGQKKLEMFEKDLLTYQTLEYKKSRRLQLESMIDKIVEQRRKLSDNRSTEEIFNEELEKSSIVTKDTIIWPIFLESKLSESDAKVVKSEDVMKRTTSLKYKVYEDLYGRGYYVTGGHKFGGDFLAYLGDPICYHAIFIVRCVESEQCIMPSEIVAFGRLGTSVRKRAVLASLEDDKVSYITISWIDA